ncbi:MAG: protein O-mannosyl-transferase family [bacterium]
MSKKLNKDERRFLRDNYGKMPNPELAKKLNLTPRELTHIIREYGLVEEQSIVQRVPMHDITKSDLLWGLPTFVIPLIIYSLTFCRTLYVGDSGEFAAMGYTLGIAHPPGYPTWVLLLKLASVFLPAGKNVAGHCNYLAVLIGASTSYMLYLLLLKIAKHRLVAILGALVFAFSYQFWAQGMIAEVYVLNAFFIIVTTLVLLTWSETQDKRYFLLLYLLCGLGLTNHNTFLAMPVFYSFFIVCSLKRNWKFRHELLYLLGYFVACGIIYFIASGVPGTAFQDYGVADFISKFFLGQPLPVGDTFLTKATTCVLIFLPYTLLIYWWEKRDRTAIYAILLFLLGISVYLYIPLRVDGNPTMSWGNPHSLEDFYNHISRRQYGPLSTLPTQYFGIFAPWDLLKEQIQTWLIFLFRQFGSFFGYVKGIIPAEFVAEFSPSQAIHGWWLGFIIIWSIFWLTLTGIGAYRLLKQNGKFFVLTLLTYLMYGPGLIVLLNFNTTNHALYIQQVFYIPSYLMIAIWMTFGMLQLVEWAKKYIFKSADVSPSQNISGSTIPQNNPAIPGAGVSASIPKQIPFLKYIAAGLLCLFPLIIMCLNYKDNDLSRNAVAYDFGMNILNSMDPEGIIYIIGDNPTFALAYLCYVEKRFPPERVYDEGENLFIMIHEFGDMKYRLGPDDHARLKDYSRAKLCAESTRPCYFMLQQMFNPDLFKDFPILAQSQVLPSGIVYYLKKPNMPEPDYAGTLSKMRDLDKYFYQMSTDYYTRELVANYHFLVGRGYYNEAERKNDPELKKKAFEQFDLTSKTGWDLDNMHINLGNLYMQNNMLKESKEEFLRAIRTQPRKAISYFSLGQLYDRDGNREKAIEMFQKGLNLGKPADRPYDNEANDYRAHFSLGMLYMQEANRIMQTVSTTSSGTNYQTQLQKEQQKNTQAAINEFMATLNLKPEVIDAYDNLGVAYAQLGNYEQAVAMWERAIQLSPNYPNPYLRLAQYYGGVLRDMQRANYYYSRFQQVSQGAMPMMPQRVPTKKK